MLRETSEAVEATQIVGDLFAGIAAAAGATSVFFARKTVNEAQDTTAQLEKANGDAAARFAMERHHRLLMQYQTVVDLLGELDQARVPPGWTGRAPDRLQRYQAIRRQLDAAVIVVRNLGGEDMSESLTLVTQNHIGFGTADELADAQKAVVAALGRLAPPS